MTTDQEPPASALRDEERAKPGDTPPPPTGKIIKLNAAERRRCEKQGTVPVWWPAYCRLDQWPEHADFTTWLLLGGRGAGKTRAGAEWVRHGADHGLAGRQKWEDGSHLWSARRIALVAETYADAREVMIEGVSGLKAVAHPDNRPVYQSSRRRLVWPKTGAIAQCFSAEDPEGLRGFQFDAAWADEVCKWRYPEETWSNLQLGLRLGEWPRQVVTTTPRPLALIKRLIKAPTTLVSRASTFDNSEHLAPGFLSDIASAYEGTRLARQELHGELIEDVEGALFTWAMIEAARISAAPPLDRVVVAVDPPATSGPDADECGIVVAGRCGEGPEATAFVLADLSARLSPDGWARRVASAFHDHSADCVVVEANQGGDLVRSVLHKAASGLPVRSVYATQGKRLRAEPVALLYERGLVRHVGRFAALEDQMASFTGDGGSVAERHRGKSPDRLDALVWAMFELIIRPRSEPRVRAG